LEAMRDEYRTVDVLRREREGELVDLRKKLNAGDFTAAEQVRIDGNQRVGPGGCQMWCCITADHAAYTTGSCCCRWLLLLPGSGHAR
jgi:hypothetical protein